MKNRLGVGSLGAFGAVQHRSFEPIHDTHSGALRDRRVKVVFVVGDEEDVIIIRQKMRAIAQHRRDAGDVTRARRPALALKKRPDFLGVAAGKTKQVISVGVLLVTLLRVGRHGQAHGV